MGEESGELSCIELDECINYVKFLALVFVVGSTSNKRKKFAILLLLLLLLLSFLFFFVFCSNLEMKFLLYRAVELLSSSSMLR